MVWNIDSVIFIGFLVANLVIGLYWSRGIRNINEYAIGERNFSTTTIAATLIATWVSGETFFSYLSDSYTHGLYAIWAYIIGEVSYFLLIGYFFAPRLEECLGALSIAEIMGNLYGKNVRIITAITGSIGVIGLVAIQLKIAGLLFEYCLGIPATYGVFVGGFIIIIYSAIGGIKSVTLTDVIQLFTFCTVVPVIAYFISSTLGGIEAVTHTLATNPLFDYRQVFNFSQPKSLYYLSIPFIIAASGFGPPMFQRIAMAKNVDQISRSFVIAAFCCLFLGLMMSWIGILVISTAPGIEGGEVVKYVLFNYSIVGLKGLILTGIMAMVMSTADSYVNSVSVLIVHDILKPIGLRIKDELLLARWSTLIIGVCSILFTMRSGNLMQLLITANLFYIPIVTTPFIVAMLGFRTTTKSVLIGMGTAFITVILWESFLKEKAAGIDGILPGMIANLIGLIGAHYILRQPGGWTGIKNKGTLIQLRQKRKAKLNNLIDSISNFNLITSLRKNSPSSDSMYLCLGLFYIISIFSTMHAVPGDVQKEYRRLIDFIYPSVFFISTILISYPLWLPSWKQKNIIIAVFWNLSIFYTLICVGFLLVIISNFEHLQLMTFMINLIIIAVLVKWQWALVMISSGLLITIEFFKLYLGVEYLPERFSSTEFEATYLLVLISSILIIFLKPKEEYQALTEDKNKHLSNRISGQEKELQEALAIRSKFIRNIEHEYHTPLTGIISMADTLCQSYDKLSDKHIREGIDTILKSSLRLSGFDANIETLYKLSKPDYKLNLEEIDFSSLVYERITLCRRLYEEDKDAREFILNIEADIQIKVDKQYLSQALDNLIINAINYCPQGKVTISLKKQGNEILFSIEDEGIGILPLELYSVFDEFVVSSKTDTPAGGRGIGLAVVKRVIEAHSGRIKAESDGEKGATFSIRLP